MKAKKKILAGFSQFLDTDFKKVYNVDSMGICGLYLF